MMRRFKNPALILITLSFLFIAGACSKRATEDPFNYPFVKQLHLKREAGKPFSDYQALYLLTEDFEPRVESVADLDGIREGLKFASELSARYKVRWTHFVEVNAFTPAFISAGQELQQRCQSMIEDLKAMADAGDDCELHLHEPIRVELVNSLTSEELLFKESDFAESHPYRQRRSFFFQSYYHQGYRQTVAGLTYGKRLLEKYLYANKKRVLAFRPGGWDHGSTARDTQLYFMALRDSGLIANSGLSTGDFGARNWRVGNDAGHNLATVSVGDTTLFEVSPTAGPGGYLNPVRPYNLEKLASSVHGELAVIVAVYHLAALQQSKPVAPAPNDAPPRSNAELEAEREALEQHFKTVADLAAAKVLYPVTLRELLEIISDQQQAAAFAGRRQFDE